ncbi:MAG: dihydropteroate synthase [Micrococcales bacterium]|nr:dihydropteroate synthase [Microbacteriaceae bacterium]NBR22582.1 dihydropteroate synthase [Micrococcales bacterium]NBX95078.1 dihydropteroate synthase [Actinomycetota bacterium]NBR77575.1 dihydropteroate synthase [Microbacteriaceae bacterium]NBS60844.1 dihydropteroate synthase [Microbacteriaceae bacterium]
MKYDSSAPKVKPLVIGVLNVTPDSFSDGNQYNSVESAVDHAKLLVLAGAQIIDIGGESTRPGAERVTLEEEQSRVVPVIKAIAELNLGAAISIDTMNAETAELAIAAGANIINDVSGGLADEAMLGVAAKHDVVIILSHWRGHSNVMNTMASYQNVAEEVATELQARVDAAIAAGVGRDKIVVDPGLGFAKDMKQNWQLVARLDEIEKLGLPILVGASRKRFIAGALDEEEPNSVSHERRDVATAVLTALLMQRKLWGVRVHNVISTVDAISIVSALHEGSDDAGNSSSNRQN